MFCLQQPGCSETHIKNLLLANARKKKIFSVSDEAGVILDIFQEFIARDRLVSDEDSNGMGNESEEGSDDHDDEIHPCEFQ